MQAQNIGLSQTKARTTTRDRACAGAPADGHWKSKERGTGRSSKQRCVHVGNRVCALGSTPREGERQSWQASSAQRKTDREAVCKLIEVDAIASERDFALIGGEGEADRAPDGVLEGFAQQQGVGSAKTVVTIAGEPGVTVDVRSAQGRLEVEGDDAAGRSDGPVISRRSSTEPSRLRWMAEHLVAPRKAAHSSGPLVGLGP